MNGMNEALSTMPANQGGHCNCTQQGNRAGQGGAAGRSRRSYCNWLPVVFGLLTLCVRMLARCWLAAWDSLWSATRLGSNNNSEMR